MIENLSLAWQATSQLEIMSVLFGLVYVILAAKENSWCWPAAFIGTGTGIYVFWDASLLMESALNVYYLAMAIFGWWQWRYGGSTSTQENRALRISSWPWASHLTALCLVLILTFISGYLLRENTSAAIPFVDSFTTWAAVLTTWMVTRKILENWLYWQVINSISIWLYIQRELYLYALLFAIYLIVAVFGYLGWRKSLVAQNKFNP